MFSKIINTTAIISVLSLMVSGCYSSRAAFPEIAEQKNTLVSDEENMAYDDTASSKAKIEKKVKAVAAPDAPVKKDLSKPEASVSDDDITNMRIEPRKTTPVTIEDMDLIGMDAEDDDLFSSPVAAQQVIKPISEKKVLLPVKKEQTVLNASQPFVPSITYLAETVYFNNGSSAVDSAYNAKLRRVVREAKKNNAYIVAQGFASSRTRNTDIITHKMTNLKVSAARAERVAAVLRKYGQPKNKIIIEGLSDSRPAYLEVMPEGERLNRRAEVYISY